MKRTVLLATIALAFSAQGQLVDSGFETWTDNLPDGWFGSKSSIAMSGVVQVTENVHGGASAVQLINGTPHKRFTTQPVAVSANTTYTVNFWVRGAGQVRVGLYDNRPGSSSGYAPYTSYINATANWTEHTVDIAAGMDAADAEFIFSVISTVAPDHIILDDVTITVGGSIPDVSIYDIQFTTLPNGDSPYNGQTVNTGGIVTAAYTGAYYIQDQSGPWEGVYVYDNFSMPSVGDRVTLTATVSEFNNLTELTGITNFTVVASGQELPAPLMINTVEANEEALEGVLVRVVNATCTEVPGGANFGKWKADDGSGFAWIGKEIYTTTPDPQLGQVFDVTGVVSYSFSLYGIQPRDANDVQLATSVNEFTGATVNVFPNPANEVLNLNISGLSGRTEYNLSDVSGRIVRSDVLVTERTTLELGNLAEGVYTLSLMNAGSSWSTRVVVQQ
ncbi:MAG: T9SS type A sorting domain-containing protein [Flavobacteriales bacterium]